MNRHVRWLWPTLTLICMAALMGVNARWNALAGQGCFRITAKTGDALTQRMAELQKNEDVELGAFSMRNLEEGPLAPATLYESVLFHPVAMGISMTEGDLPFLAEAADKLLLHRRTASRLIPTGNCLGQTVQVEGDSYQVAGIYRSTGLWKNEATGILSAREEALRPVYVWMRTAKDDVFAYEHLRRALVEENQGVDAASFAGVDLTKRGASAQMVNALALFFMALLLARGLWSQQRGSRQKFRQIAQENFQRRYFPGAMLRCIGPFVRYMGGTLLCGGVLVAGALLLQGGFSQGAAALPEQLLSLRAWSVFLRREHAAIRAMWEMPMVACRTGGLLLGWGLALDIAGLASAGWTLVGKRKKERAGK